MESPTDISTALGPAADGVCVRVKVVPGASRSRVVGMLGDRLKLAVAAPPEDGKANRAVCKLLAEVLGVSAKSIAVTAGPAQPKKTITVTGVSLAQAEQTLAALLSG